MKRLKKISVGRGFLAGEREAFLNRTVRNAVKAFAFLAFLAFATVFLAGCLVPQGGNQASLSQSREDNYYENRNRESRTREATIRRSKDRYSGPDCEEDKDCIAVCRKIYRSSARDKCEELAAEQVENLWHIYRTLERPSASALDEIDAEDFKVFVDLDRRPLDKALGSSKLRPSEGKRVIAWMMSSEDVAKVFKGADDDFDVLKDLLNSLGDSGEHRYQNAMKKTVSDGKGIMELAIEEQGEVLEWLHEFIEDQVESDSDWDNHEELGVLGDWYCRILSKHDEDVWNGLVDYRGFQSVADVILDGYTTKGADRTTKFSWWTDDLKEEGVVDLDDSRDLYKLCNPIQGTQTPLTSTSRTCKSEVSVCIVPED